MRFLVFIFIALFPSAALAACTDAMGAAFDMVVLGVLFSIGGLIVLETAAVIVRDHRKVKPPPPGRRKWILPGIGGILGIFFLGILTASLWHSHSVSKMCGRPLAPVNLNEPSSTTFPPEPPSKKKQ